MSSNICYVCDKQTDWRNNFSKIKTQHSKTAIVELLEKFLGNFKTKRDLKNKSNRICIECITKIDEYDWTCVLMLNREKEIRKILLRTEKLYAERNVSGFSGNAHNHNSFTIDSESEWAKSMCGGIQEPKIEIKEIETNTNSESNSLNEFTNQSEKVTIKDCNSDEDFEEPNDDDDEDYDDDDSEHDNNSGDGDYDPPKAALETEPSKRQRRSTRTCQKMIDNSIEPSASNDESEKKSKRGRKKGQKNSGMRFSAKCSECEQEFKSANSYMVKIIFIYSIMRNNNM